MGKFINPFTDYGFKKIFGAVCFFKSEVDVSQMLLLKASFQDYSLSFSTNSDEARQ